MLEDNQYAICIGLLDTTDCLGKTEELNPVFPEDLEKHDIIKLISNHSGMNTMKVSSFFLRADYPMVMKLVNRKRYFQGEIKTKSFRYGVKIRIVNDIRYIQEIIRMYHIFENNKITWVTPCVPYFLRMFDVYVEGLEIPEYEQIESLTVDYEEFRPYICSNLVPAWNIRKEQIRSDTRPVFDESKKKFRHVINGNRLLQNSKYLIADENSEVILKSQGDIEIYCDSEAEKVWKVYNFFRVTEKSQYELFSNQNRVQHSYGIETLSGIQECIKELGYRQRFEIVKIVKESEIKHKQELYHINQWVQDFANYDYAKLPMKIILKSKIDDEWQMDVLSYIVDELNYEYPKYHFEIELV